MDKIIIDTDVGHDDVLALFLLFKSKLFDIEALTIACGNSTIRKATRNAFYVKKILDFNTPIYSGLKKPLVRDLVMADVHGKSCLAGANLKGVDFILTNNASEKIIELAKKSQGKTTILTLGPLTNVGKAIKMCPELHTLIKRVVIMGGAIDVCGNKNRVGEFNMFVDPEAADIVFRSTIEKVLIPLDPCNEIVLKEGDFKRIKNGDLYIPIMKMMKEFIKNIEKYEGVRGALVYDAIAAYYLINPKAFELKEMDIVIETKGEHTSGMTVSEKRKVANYKPNIKVATKVDSNMFINDFVRILG